MFSLRICQLALSLFALLCTSVSAQRKPFLTSPLPTGVRLDPAGEAVDLGNIVASGRATAEQWAAYWSGYAEDVERQRREKERNERELAEKQVQQKPFEDTHTPQVYYHHRDQSAHRQGIMLVQPVQQESD